MSDDRRFVEAIESLRRAHQSYRHELLPHPETDDRVSYSEYDDAMNVALEGLEAAVSTILNDLDREPS